MNEAILAAKAVSGQWTPGAYGIWTLVVLAAGSIILALVRQIPSLKTIGAQSDASLRMDLMKRITELEKSQVESEARHSREMEEERHRCDERITKMEGEIKGLYNILINTQAQTGAVLNLPATAPTAAARFGLIKPE